VNDNKLAKQGGKLTVRVNSEFKDLIPEFLEALKNDVNALQRALGQDDYQAICKMGHSLKGMGGSCGFDAITDMGGDLEKAAKAMRLEDIRKIVEMLALYIEQVEVVYE